MPDYALAYREAEVSNQSDIIIFINRGSMPVGEPSQSHGAINVTIKPDTYTKARLVAPGWDIYRLEGEWREWMTEHPRNPDAAFIGFCRKVYEKRGRP